MSTASAPGKIMLTGEYAVLHGHRAVVVTVGKRVTARFGSSPSKSRLIHHLAERVGQSDPDAGERARTIEVDSSELYDGDHKLGLGSSAAVAVAATTLALGDDDPVVVRRLALHAHRAAQAERGAAGSGADIGACAHGGAVAVRAGEDDLEVEPLTLPGNLDLVLVWTGIAADTASLVAQVAAAGQRDPEEFDSALGRIAAASEALVAACEAGDAPSAVAAIHAGGAAHLGLAAITGVPLITPVHKQIRAMAAPRGGAAKPTGAGGGDIALAAFPGRTQADAFRRDLYIAGMHTLNLRVGVKGAKLR